MTANMNAVKLGVAGAVTALAGGIAILIGGDYRAKQASAAEFADALTGTAGTAPGLHGLEIFGWVLVAVGALLLLAGLIGYAARS